RVERISRALLRGSYRHDPGLWEAEPEGEEDGAAELPPSAERRPYFEVLVLRDGVTPEQAQRVRDEMRKLRRPEDPFIYEIVQVPSFEDAVLGVLCNYNVQAVVLYDGFSFRSRFELPVLRSQLARHLPSGIEAAATESLGVTLAKVIHALRPE